MLSDAAWGLGIQIPKEEAFGSCWVVSCPMERPVWQGREGGLWLMAHKDWKSTNHHLRDCGS